MLEPEVIIGLIRDSFKEANYVYTNGSCFELYKILKSIFPSAVAWSNHDHVYTEINEIFYDINGRRELGSEGLYKMSDEPRQFEKAHNWKYRSTWRLTD